MTFILTEQKMNNISHDAINF